MKPCPYCGNNNMEGVLFCDECGQPLVGRSGQTTSQLVQQQTHSLRGRATWGTARFDLASSIVIHVRDHLEPISLVPKQEMLIGRTDTQSDFTPDLDMTPYGAAEYGVSRQHAIIKRGEDTLTLTDLGSTNGTHLNGQRLIPRQPRVLRDGDEIRLGRLVFHIFFK